MKLFMKVLLSVIGLLAISLLSNCTPGQQTGAKYGALGGAAIAVLSGDNTEGVITKTGVGAAIGAGVVALHEEHQKNTQATTSTPTTSYPYATRTETEGLVKSPYAPYNPVNVQGISSGTKVTEPGSPNIFLVP